MPASTLWAGGGAVALGYFGFRYWGYRYFPFWFKGGQPGTETPEDHGLPFRQVTIMSGRCRLAAWWVPAPEDGASGKAVVIYHGNQETLTDWPGAIAWLHAAGHAVLAFDYAGFGDSTGLSTPRQLQRDAWAAFHRCRELAGPSARIYLVGFSLGCAVLLHTLGRESRGAAGMVLVGAYASVRDMLPRLLPLPRWSAFLFPNLHNDLRAIRQTRLPTLLLHSTDDEVVPVAQARRLAERGGPEVRAREVDGPDHADLLRDPGSAYWDPLLSFLAG
ncbi:MAG TPA: alpha/beta fold hydrolase [Gammaproteobacteria bacterium]|nr:alpha/beta fold hydrolase [Gammaproteobacteria bacterium]